MPTKNLGTVKAFGNTLHPVGSCFSIKYLPSLKTMHLPIIIHRIAECIIKFAKKAAW